MEGVQSVESLRQEILGWFDNKRAKIEGSFPQISEQDLRALKSTLDSIDTEYNGFNDFITKG